MTPATHGSSNRHFADQIGDHTDRPPDNTIKRHGLSGTKSLLAVRVKTSSQCPYRVGILRLQPEEDIKG
jgi:hypothetical protein